MAKGERVAIFFDRLDHEGLAAVLKSAEVRALVDDVAAKVGADVRAAHPDADVVVESGTSDRARASVTIRDARGRLWQVRDGVLTRAAVAAGVEVKGSAE